MIRDVRDILVSNYFEIIKRQYMYYTGDRQLKGTLSSYIYSDIGSLDTIIKFYNIWFYNKTIPLDFLLIRYEDMKENTEREIIKILNFLELSEIPLDIIYTAITYASFENMRQLELKNEFQSFILKPGNIHDLESYKTRKGVVGGYINYFRAEEIIYLNSKMSSCVFAHEYL